MDLHVPSRLLSALAVSHLGASWKPFSLSRELAGKGPGWEGGLPAAKGGRVRRRDQSSDPDQTQRWSSGRPPSRRGSPGTLPAAAAPRPQPREALWRPGPLAGWSRAAGRGVGGRESAGM